MESRNKVQKNVKAVRYRLPLLGKEADTEQKQLIISLESAAQAIEEDENDPICENEEGQEIEDRPLFGNLEHIPSVKTSTPTRWHSILEMLESMALAATEIPLITF